MDETEIRSFFARYGSVKEVKIITDRTGVSKGWVKHMFNINYNKYLNYIACIEFQKRKIENGFSHLHKRNLLLCNFHVEGKFCCQLFYLIICLAFVFKYFLSSFHIRGLVSFIKELFSSYVSQYLKF